VKIHGKKIDGPKEQLVVIPRPSGDVVFKARAVRDFSDFDKICPLPTPPEVIRPGGVRSLDPEDLDYKKKLDEWARNKSTWMIVKSLDATPGLEWDTIDWAKSETWKNYETELMEAGFSAAEMARIIGIVMDACGLNQEKIDEATERFLAAQGATQNTVVSQGSEQNSTPSGVSAKG